MTDSGKCAFVLGIELLDGTNGSVTLCQRRYVNDILKRFNMDECKVVASPVDVSSQLVSSDATTWYVDATDNCNTAGHCTCCELCVMVHGEPPRRTLGCG